MHPIFDIDWHGLLVPTVSLLELVLRGSAIYLGILVLMRVLRRDAGTLSTADLLVVVLIADAAQNAMASEYHSITQGAADVAQVKQCYLEADGRLSVINRSSEEETRAERKRAVS
jgi:uncharacterized membrane protein YcaP (DUF421 family)